jgi:uncharacterized glyoxalase superfamily protein PhnB
MSENSVRVEVVVEVDPATAFRIFTDEVDLWWVRGPANFYDGARARGMRFEPDVGGRFIQLNDGVADRELGRITLWEPGARLTYETGDGSTVDVRFEPIDGGTRVVVQQRGGGMSAWKNILDWFEHRVTTGYQAGEMPRITPVLFYADVPAAAEWLVAAFGFWCRGRMGADLGELELGGGVVLLRRADEQHIPARSMTYAYVDDLETHFHQARQAGATILNDIHRRGDTQYIAEDLEHHGWTFAQARASMRRGS